jgi:hypothetical protein
MENTESNIMEHICTHNIHFSHPTMKMAFWMDTMHCESISVLITYIQSMPYEAL